MYTLCDKAVSLTPYDPSEGRYRVRMEGEQGVCKGCGNKRS